MKRDTRATVHAYTRDEAARMARMGVSAFDEALKRGAFPSIKVGRRVLIPARRFESILAGEDLERVRAS